MKPVGAAPKPDLHKVMQYLVDTDWAIDYMNGIPRVVQRYDELASQGIGLSIISLAELYDGVYGVVDYQSAEQGLQDFLDDIEMIVPLDAVACRIFAMERVRLRSAGTRIDDLDLLIGSTALRHGLTLLTNNRRHFERMSGLSVISI